MTEAEAAARWRPDAVIFAPMTAERLAMIRAEVTRPPKYALEADAKDIACELLIEVDRLRMRLAEIGGPELQQRVIGLKGRVSPVSDWDLERSHLWAPGVRLEERDVYPTPWRPAGRTDGAKS